MAALGGQKGSSSRLSRLVTDLNSASGPRKGLGTPSYGNRSRDSSRERHGEGAGLHSEDEEEEDINIEDEEEL